MSLRIGPRRTLLAPARKGGLPIGLPVLIGGNAQGTSVPISTQLSGVTTVDVFKDELIIISWQSAGLLVTGAAGTFTFASLTFALTTAYVVTAEAAMRFAYAFATADIPSGASFIVNGGQQTFRRCRLYKIANVDPDAPINLLGTGTSATSTTPAVTEQPTHANCAALSITSLTNAQSDTYTPDPDWSETSVGTFSGWGKMSNGVINHGSLAPLAMDDTLSASRLWYKQMLILKGR